LRRFAARTSGLASGLALAVRPVGAEARALKGGSRRSFCGAVRKDLRVPLTPEEPPRTMRGAPAPSRDFLTAAGTLGIRTTAHPARAGPVTGGALEPVPPACGCGAADRRQRRARWASARRARQAAAPE
jgi:hypothetical protein